MFVKLLLALLVIMIMTLYFCHFTRDFFLKKKKMRPMPCLSWLNTSDLPTPVKTLTAFALNTKPYSFHSVASLFDRVSFFSYLGNLQVNR